jgi:hypothetical protein
MRDKAVDGETMLTSNLSEKDATVFCDEVLVTGAVPAGFAVELESFFEPAVGATATLAVTSYSSLSNAGQSTVSLCVPTVVHKQGDNDPANKNFTRSSSAETGISTKIC